MAEQGKPKKVSYATSLLRGAYDGDIFQHYLKGAIIEMEPFDTFKANFPGQTDEWYGTNYGAAQFNLENRFKKRNFDPHKVSGRYSNSFRKDPNFDAPDVWSPIPSDEFIKTGSASAYIIPGADKGADIVERQHTQKIADQNKIYRDNEGVLKPLEFHTDQDNFLYQGWDDETMSNIWHELKPGEIGDPNEMRAHRLLGTSASLESSSLGSILRGGWSGAGSKSIKAAAGTLTMINDVQAFINSFGNSKTFDEAYAESTFYDESRYLMNLSNYANRMNDDEKQGAFEAWNSFLFHTSDGITQFAPMIASSAIGGTAAFSAGRLVSGGRAMLGKAAAKTVTGDGFAAFTSKMYGSMTVFGMMSEELERLGYDRSSALMFTYGAALGTYASESMFTNDLNEKLGWKLAGQWARKADDKTMVKLGKNIYKDDAEKLAVLEGIDTAIKTGKKGAKVSKHEGQRVKNFIHNVRYNVFKLGEEAGWPKFYIYTAAEEGIEEGIEGGFHKLAAMWFNSHRKEVASNNINIYNGIEKTELANGKWRIRYRSGKEEVVSLEEKLAIDETIETSNKVLTGELLLDETYNWDELGIAAIAAGLTGGPLTHMSHRKKKKQEREFFGVSLGVSQDPTRINEVDNVGQNWINRGWITAEQWEATVDQEGNIIDPGMKESMKSSIQLLADQITASGITSPEVWEALGQDVPLAQELFTAMAQRDKLKDAMKAWESSETLEGEEKKTARAEFIDNVRVKEGSTVKEMEDHLAKLEVQISELISPKATTYDNNGSEEKSKTSERHSEKMNKAYAINAMVTIKARSLADSKRKVWDWIDSKIGGKVFNEKRRSAWITGQENAIKEDFVKLGQLGAFGFRTNSPYQMMKKWTDQWLPAVSSIVEAYKQQNTKKNKLSPEDEAGLDIAIQQAKDLMAVEIEYEETEVSEAKEGEEPKETTVTKKTSLEKIFNEAKKENRKETVEQITNNKSLEDAYKQLGNHITKLGEMLNRSALPFRAEVKARFNDAKAIFERYSKLKHSISDYLTPQELDLDGNDLGTGGLGLNTPEVAALDQSYSQGTEAAFLELRKVFEEFTEETVGALAVDAEVKIDKDAKVPIADIDKAAMDDRLGFVFGRNTSTEKLFGKDLTAGLGAIFTILADMQVKDNEAGGQVKPVGHLFMQLNEVFKSPNAPLKNPDAAYDQIVQILDGINAVGSHLDLMEMTNKEIYAHKKRREHAVTAPKLNRDKILSEQEIARGRKMIEALREILNTWVADKRMESVVKENYGFKVRSAHFANRVASLKYIYSKLNLELDEKDRPIPPKDMKDVNELISKIDKAIEEEVKGDDQEGETEDGNVTAEALSMKYSMIKDADQKRDIERLMASLEGIADRIEEKLAGKLTKFKKAFIDSYDRPPTDYNVFNDITFSINSATMDRSYSYFNFNKGHQAYEIYLASKKKKFSDSIPTGTSTETSRIQADFFMQSVLATLQDIETFGTKQNGIVMPTKRQALKMYNKIVEGFKGKDRPLETWEQVNQMLELLAYQLSADPDYHTHKSDRTEKLPGAMMITGYAGTGKSDISSMVLVAMAAIITEKVQTVGVIIPTTHLKEDYEIREEELKALLGNEQVKFRYMFTDELGPDDNFFKETDFVFVEEVSMFSESGVGNDISLLEQVQKHYKDTNALSKMYLIGDKGQVGSTTNTATHNRPFLITPTVTNLSEIFRTGMVPLFLLQEHFREVSKREPFLSFVKSEWKQYENGDRAGIHYVPKQGAQEVVVNEFLKARAAKKDAILILPTYAARQELLDKGSDKLRNEKAHVKVLEYDSEKVRADSELRNINVAGMKADEVYIPFAPDELFLGGPNTKLVYKDNGFNEHYGMSARMMLSAVSRAGRFVMMGAMDGESKDLSGTDQIIAGYDDVVAPDTEVEDPTAEDELTPNQLRERRVRDVNRRVGDGVPGYRYGQEDTPVEVKKEEEPETPEEKPIIPEEKPPIDVVPEPKKEPVIDSNIVLPRSSETVGYHQAIQDAQKKLIKARTTPTGVDVVDAIYDDKLGVDRPAPDSFKRIRSQMVNRAITYAMAEHNPFFKKRFDESFDEYFDASKARLPGLHDENLREGLRRSVLDSARMLVATEAFGFGDGTIVSPALQKSNHSANPLVVKVVGIAQDGTPIVDVYTYRTVRDEVGTIEAIDPIKGKESDGTPGRNGINAESLGAMAAVLKAKGYEINQLHILQVVDKINSGIFEIGQSFTLDDEAAVDVIGKQYKRLYGASLNNDEILALKEDLYFVERHVDSVQLKDGQDNEILIERGTGLTEDNGKAAVFVKDITVVYEDRQFKHKLIVVDHDGNTKEVYLDEINRDYSIPVWKDQTAMFMSNAIEYRDMGTVFSSTVVVPYYGSGIPKDDFWGPNNKWLDGKKKTVQAFLKGKYDTLEKVYVSQFEVHQPDQTGAVTKRTFDHAMINRLSSEQINQMAKDSGISRKEIIANGYDIISIDGQPELGFKVQDPETKKITSGANEWQTKDAEGFEKVIAGKVSDRGIRKTVEESFANEPEADIKEALIEFQLYKINQLKAGYAKVKSSGASEAVVGLVTLQSKIEYPLNNHGSQMISGTDIIARMKNEGFAWTGRSRFNPKAPKVEGEKKRVILIFEKEGHQDVQIAADGKRFDDLSWKFAIDEAIKELENLPESYKVMMDQFDALLEPEVDQDGKVLDTWKDDKDRLAKKLIPQFMESKASNLIMHNKSRISTLIGEKTNGLHRWIKISTKSNEVQFSGYKLADRVRLQIKSLKALKMLSGDQFFMPVYRIGELHEERRMIRLDNIETNTQGTLQPQIFTSASVTAIRDEAKKIIDDSGYEKPSSPFEADNIKIEGQQYNYISKDQALEQLIQIFGENVFKALKINTDLIKRNGNLSFGRIENGMMLLADISGYMEATTPRHEAIHLILHYLVDDNTRASIINEAKKRMVKAGLASVAQEVTYKQAHEYIAEQYGENRYRKQPFNTMTWWGKILNFFDSIIQTFTNGFKSDQIQDLFQKADRGGFIKAFEAYDAAGVEDATTFDNQYSSANNIEAIDTLLNGWDNAKALRNAFLTPSIIAISKYGKATSSDVSRAYPDHFSASVKKTLQGVEEAITIWDEDDTKFGYTDSKGERVSGLTFDDIDYDHFVEAASNRKLAGNAAVMQVYFYNLLSQGGAVRLDKPRKKDVDGIYHIKGRDISLTLLQDAFENLDMEAIEDSDYNGGMKSSKSMHIMLDKETTNPMGSLSSWNKMMIEQTPFRNVVEEDGRIVSDKVLARKINGRLADAIFLQASAAVRAQGDDLTTENLMSQIDYMALEASPGEYKNTAHSLSVHFGDRESMKHAAFRTNMGTNPPDGTIDYLSSLRTQRGLGYLAIIGKTSQWLQSNLGISKEDAQALLQREKFFKDLLNGISNHYYSLANTVHVRIQEYGRGSISIVKSKSLDKTMTNNRLLSATYQTIFNPNDSFMQKKYREMWDGEKRKYDLRSDGLYIRSEKSWKRILTLKGKQGLFPTSLGKKEVALRVQELLNDMFPKQRISLEVVSAIIGKDPFGKGVNTSMIGQMFYMALALKKTAIDSNNWYSLKEGEKFEASDISKSLAGILDAYQISTKGVVPPEAVKVRRSLAEGEKQVESIPVYTHLQYTTFVHDYLADEISKNKSNAASRAIYTVDGERRYAYQETSTLTDIFPNSGFENPTTAVATKNIQRKARAMFKDDPASLDKTPLIYLDPNDNDNPLRYNDPILNNEIVFDYIGEYDGMKSPYYSVKPKNLNEHTYLAHIFELTRAHIKKDRHTVPAFIETMSDRISLSFTNWLSGSLFRVSRNKNEKVSTVTIDSEKFVRIARDFVRYAAARSKQIKGKNSHSDWANVDANKFEAQLEANDYDGAMETVMVAFEPALKDFDTAMKEAGLGDQDTLTIQGKTIEYEGIIDAVNKYGGKTELIQKLLEDLQESLSSNEGVSYRELTQTRGLLFKQLQKLRDSNEQWKETNSDFYKETQKPLGLMFDDIIPKNAEKTAEASEIGKIMFWSHNFINNSVNHLARGDVSKFNGFSDYIKRGIGFGATGSPYNNISIGNSVNIALVEDPKLSDTVFDGEVAATDGARMISPVFHWLMWKAKGAETGNLSFSAQKNVDYNYDPLRDIMNYYKMSDIPINYSLAVEPHYADMLKVMFGEDLWGTYGKRIMASHHSFKQVMEEIGNNILAQLQLNDGESDILNKMVSVIAYEETQKGERDPNLISKYIETTNADGEKVLTLDPTINSAKRYQKVPTDQLRLQQVSGGFMFGKKRPVLTQMDNIVSAGSWNSDIATRINNALSLSVTSERDQIVDNMGDPTLMEDSLKGANRSKGSSHKLYRVVSNDAIDHNVWALKGIGSIITQANDALKPKVSGASVIQSPFLSFVYEKNGQIYRYNELSKSQRDNYKKKGFVKRELKPFEFIVDGKVATTKQEVLDATDVKMLHQEVIMPFTYTKEFGISYGKSLNELFTVGQGTGEATSYRTRRGSSHVDGETLWTGNHEITGMKKFKDYEGIAFLNLFDDDVARWVIDRMLSDGRLKLPLSVTDNPEIDILQWFKTGMLFTFQDQKIKNQFMFEVTGYFELLNQSLDVYAARIPSTNASSGFPSRIVSILWDYDNTVFVSSKKNILDGSDFDIDELHVIHRPIHSGLTTKEYNVQNEMFEAIYDYYEKPGNALLILQRVDTAPLVKLAEQYKSPYIDREADITTSAREREANMSGKALVSHFANLEKVLLRLMQIPHNKREEILPGISAHESLLSETSPLMLDDVESLAKIINTTSILINGATDNSKLGGILGRLNINEWTSGIVGGLVAAGYDMTAIAALLNNEEFVEIQQHFKAKKKKQITAYEALFNLVNEDSSQELKQLLQAALVGEQLRRLTQLVSLEQGIKNNMFAIYQKKVNFEETFGVATLHDAIDTLNKNERVEFNLTDNVESAVQTTFNIYDVMNELPLIKDYLKLFSSTYDYIDSNFIVTPELEIFGKIKSIARIEHLNHKDSFNAVMGELENILIGHYLDTVTVPVGDVSYNLSNITRRVDFITDAPDWLDQMRKRNQGNTFLAHLDYETAEQGIPVYKFSDSILKDDEEKARFKEEFLTLSEEDKNMLRNYQAIMYGFKFQSGSFFEMMDDVLEQDYSKWLETVDAKAILNDDDNVETVISRTSAFLPDYKYSDYSREVDLLGNFHGRKKIGNGDDMTMDNISTPFPFAVNTHGATNTVFYYPKLSEVKYSEDFSEEGTSVKINGFNRVRNFPRPQNPRYISDIYTGDKAISTKGIVRVVHIDDNNIRVTKEASLYINPRSKTKNSNIRTYSISDDVLSDVLRALKSAFPKIKVRLLDNSSVPKHKRGQPGWIGSDGMIYLNTDLVQADTPFHEYGHIVVGLLKTGNVAQFNKLITLAQELVSSGDSLANWIYGLYPNETHQNRLEEVAVGILGIRSSEQAVKLSMASNKNASAVNGMKLWNRIKDGVRSAWKAFMAIFKKSYNVEFLDDFDSIEEFSQKVIQAVKDGKQITSLTSAGYSHLVDATVKDSRIHSVANNIHQFNEHLNNPRGDDEYKKIREFTQAANVQATIQSYEGVVPKGVFGESVYVKDFEALEKTDKLVLDIVKNLDKRDDQAFTNIFDILSNMKEPGGYINPSGTRQGYLDNIFGTTATNKPHVTVEDFNNLIKGIHYSDKNEYMTLSQFSDKYNVSIPEHGDLNVIVSVEFGKENEQLISLYGVTLQGITDTYLNDGAVNIMTSFNVSERKARTRGVTLKNNMIGKTSLTLGYLATAIMQSSPNVQVKNAGLIRPRFSQGSRSLYTIDLNEIARQLRGISSFEEVKAYMSADMLNTFKKAKSGYFNWVTYLNTFTNEDEKDTAFDALPLKVQVERINEKIRKLIEKKIETKNLSQEEEQELSMLTEYHIGLNNGQLLDSSENPRASIGKMTRYVFDQNAIGERNFNIVRQTILNSSNKIVKESEEVREKLAVLHDRMLDAQGISRASLLGANRAKAIFEPLFDYIIDSNGDRRRTGMIYWTNKVESGMSMEEKKLAKRARANGVSQEILDIGKEYVKIVEDLLLENARHELTLSRYTKTKDWSRDELLKIFRRDSSYNKGFIPMMVASSGELMSRGRIGKSVDRIWKQTTDMATLMEEAPGYEKVEKEQKYITSINDTLFAQVGFGTARTRYTPFGSSNRMTDIMGMRQIPDARGEPQWHAQDPKRNNDASYDIENMLDYFTVSTKRTVIHETSTLPIVNAIKFGLNIADQFEGTGSKTIIAHIDDYVDAAVIGIKKDETGGDRIGLIRVGQGFELANKIARPLVMTLNPSIAQLSAQANFLFGATEAVANSLAGTANFGIGDMMKASGIFASQYAKATTIARNYQVVSMTEFDLLHMPTRKTTQKSLVSTFGASALNYGVDFYARTVTMIAQMLKDGSWDAHTYNAETGKVEYDANKDKRFANRKNDPEQQVLYDHLNKRLQMEGYDPGSRAYDFQESRKFKTLADRYVIGAFDVGSKSILNQYVIGRASLMFSNWFVSKVSDAFGQDKTSKEGGRWMTQKIDGQIVPVWEEVFIEGYAVTLYKTLGKLITFNWNELADLKQGEKKNLYKSMAIASSWFLIFALFQGLKWDDDLEPRDKNDWMETKAISNIMYAANSLVVLPSLWEKVDSPFAAISILKRGFIDAYGGWTWSNFWNIVPLSRTYNYIDEIVAASSDKTIREHFED